MNKLKDQFAYVGRLWLSPETRQIFATAFGRIAEMVVETLRLVWLLFCLVCLMAVWSGAGARKALTTLVELPARFAARKAARQAERQRQEPVSPVASAKQMLASVGTNGAAFAIAKAKAQLGIETKSAIADPDRQLS
ncbi:MAG: hypothetical protein ACFB9N_12145 [Geitlerinemataceae cyanobacterium]